MRKSELSPSLLELLRHQRSKLQGRLVRVKDHDKTTFGMEEEARISKALELIRTLIEVFGA